MSPLPTPLLLSADDRADLQGFVTSGFGHLPSTFYAFLTFGESEYARRWIRSVATSVTTARSWRNQPGLPKSKPVRTFNLAFTAAGLKTLGLPTSSLETFPGEFLQGMALEERSRILGDTGTNAPAHWHLGGPQQPPIHAIAILHAASPNELDQDRDRFLTACAAHGLTLSAEEFGQRPTDDREPFGFRDGIAQPQMEGIHGQGVRTGEFILGYVNEYGYLPVAPLVEPCDDPRNLLPPSNNPHQSGWHDLGRNGTYLVYRKLQQHVTRFWSFIANESKRMHGSADPNIMAWLAAKMMGRWPDGTPATLSPDREDPSMTDADSFLYAAHDSAGRGCPFGAHIRRMNPRDHLPPAADIESLHMTARHRLLRRGRPFGLSSHPVPFADRLASFAATFNRSDPIVDSTPTGIHFLCLNASIKRQFEFLQQAWANNPQFAGLTRNPDPIIGNRDSSDLNPCMRIPGARFEFRTAPLPEFVTVRGGAYFFMPGLRALQFLAGT